MLAIVNRIEEMALNCDTLDEKGNALTEEAYARYLAVCDKAGVEPTIIWKK